VINDYLWQIDDSLEIKDQFRSNFKMRGMPRNGAGYSLPRRNLMNPRKESFMLEGAIDPNNIRARTDPDSSLPTLNRQSEFSFMPSSVKPSKNQESLIKLSHQSEMNYRNRFQPQSK
jgi:hypothetical protein